MGTRSAVKRRVVVTGIGGVSPNGIGREAFWNATRRGQSGVRRITRFDASRHQVQIAGEVTDFDEFVEPKERQHVSRAVPEWQENETTRLQSKLGSRHEE